VLNLRPQWPLAAGTPANLSLRISGYATGCVPNPGPVHPTKFKFPCSVFSQKFGLTFVQCRCCQRWHQSGWFGFTQSVLRFTISLGDMVGSSMKSAPLPYVELHSIHCDSISLLGLVLSLLIQPPLWLLSLLWCPLLVWLQPHPALCLRIYR